MRMMKKVKRRKLNRMIQNREMKWKKVLALNTMVSTKTLMKMKIRMMRMKKMRKVAMMLKNKFPNKVRRSNLRIKKKSRHLLYSASVNVPRNLTHPLS
jgi:hypothetical protein